MCSLMTRVGMRKPMTTRQILIRISLKIFGSKLNLASQKESFKKFSTTNNNF